MTILLDREPLLDALANYLRRSLKTFTITSFQYKCMLFSWIKNVPRFYDHVIHWQTNISHWYHHIIVWQVHASESTSGNWIYMILLKYIDCVLHFNIYRKENLNVMVSVLTSSVVYRWFESDRVKQKSITFVNVASPLNTQR